MTDTKNLIELYSAQILALAANIPLTNRLQPPAVSVTKRSPICGSMITIDIDIDIENNEIKDFGQQIRACALGQASASIFASQIIGTKTESVFKLHSEILNMLKNKDFSPSEPFEKYKLLSPASDYKNRHASIMLVIEATIEGISLISS